MAGLLPESESALAEMIPQVNRPGVFPREDLAFGEKVVFEVRPKLSPGQRLLVGFGAVWFAFFALIGLVSIGRYGVGEGTGVILLFGAPGYLALLGGVMGWQRTAYALTNQRVMVRAGGNMESATFDGVRSVDLDGTRIVFQLPPVGPAGPNRRLTWSHVPDETAVAPFLASAVAFYRMKGHDVALRQRLAFAEMQTKITCQYCGNLVDVGQLKPADPRCPFCSAPMVLPPTGV